MPFFEKNYEGFVIDLPQKMAEDRDKLSVILEREDKEFRRAMEEEVSTLFSSKFSNEYRILAGVDIITQHQVDLPIFKQCLALFPWWL